MLFITPVHLEMLSLVERMIQETTKYQLGLA